MKLYKFADLPADDLALSHSIKALPIIPNIFNLNTQQLGWTFCKVEEWNFIAEFIKYRQTILPGYSKAQFEISIRHDGDITDVLPYYILLISKANIYFCMLQLTISSFYDLRDKALEIKGMFPFHDARNFFSKILFELSEHEVKEVFNFKQADKPTSLTKSRKDFKKFKNFFIQENHDWEAFLKSSPYWCDFWAYLVRDYYLNSTRKTSHFKAWWEDYLKSLATFHELINKKTAQESLFLTPVNWDFGCPYLLSNKSKPDFLPIVTLTLQNLMG